jgi:hypothetical protein
MKMLLAAAAVMLAGGAAHAQSVPAPPASPWQTEEMKTAIDGHAGIESILIGQALANRDVPALLVARCFQHSTELYVKAERSAMSFDWRMAFAYHTDTPVRYRINDGPIQQANWNGSLDNDAVGAWRGSAIPILKALAKADSGAPVKLTLEAQGMRGPSSYKFDVTGIKTAIAPIAKECGWAL